MTETPSELLAGVLRSGAIRTRPVPLFETAPSFERPVEWQRIEGMLLGLAIGDALGNPSESLPPAFRRRRYGFIRDYLPNPLAGGARVGLPSDDTQLAFRTLEQRLADGHFDPTALAARFANEPIFGIGHATGRFVLRWQAGHSWNVAGTDSAGNGALMRIAGVVPWYGAHPSPDLWAEAALNTMVTHNNAVAIASSVAWVGLLWALLQMSTPPEPNWWLDAFCRALRAFDVADVAPSGGRYLGFSGRLTDYLELCIGDARSDGLGTLAACNRWRSGAYLLETLPSVLFILERHGHDAEAALCHAVNDTYDNDTVGAIVGAAVGALHGSSALPRRWIDGLLGRIARDDDGRVPQIIGEIHACWFAS